jgi:hypothetical protein
MKPHVRGLAREDRQVFRPVIVSDSVLMMNDLSGQDLTTEHLFDNHEWMTNVSIRKRSWMLWHPDIDVTIESANQSALPTMVAGPNFHVVAMNPFPPAPSFSSRRSATTATAEGSEGIVNSLGAHESPPSVRTIKGMRGSP